MALEYTKIGRDGSKVRRTLEELTEKPEDKPAGVAGGINLHHCLSIATRHYKGDFDDLRTYRICSYDEYPELSEHCAVVIAFYK